MSVDLGASSGSYSYEFKSDELWEEIKYVLDMFADPLTKLFQATMQLLEASIGASSCTSHTQSACRCMLPIRPHSKCSTARCI